MSAGDEAVFSSQHWGDNGGSALASSATSPLKTEKKEEITKNHEQNHVSQKDRFVLRKPEIDESLTHSFLHNALQANETAHIKDSKTSSRAAAALGMGANAGVGVRGGSLSDADDDDDDELIDDPLRSALYSNSDGHSPVDLSASDASLGRNNYSARNSDENIVAATSIILNNPAARTAEMLENWQPKPHLTLQSVDDAAKVLVQNPEKVGEGVRDAFISYSVITTEKAARNGHRISVRRRYGDFVWLYGQLCRENPATPIPPLPSKHRAEYTNRFNPEFIEKRQAALQRFMNRVVSHPTLQKCAHLQKFLEEPDWSATHELKHKDKVFENVSGALFGAFTKSKQKDEQIVAIKEVVTKLEDNLTQLEKMASKLCKRHSDMAIDMDDFASSTTSLAQMETDLTVQLDSFARTVTKNAALFKETTTLEENHYLANLKEYVRFCHSVKHTIKVREQKQAEYENLTETLQYTIAEKEKAQIPGRSASLGGFLKAKLDDFKGVDPDQARLERIARLERRISELQESSQVAKEISVNFLANFLKEWELWQKIKAQEFKTFINQNIENQLTTNQRALEFWEHLLPVLQTQ